MFLILSIKSSMKNEESINIAVKFLSTYFLITSWNLTLCYGNVLERWFWPQENAIYSTWTKYKTAQGKFSKGWYLVKNKGDPLFQRDGGGSGTLAIVNMAGKSAGS